jgi:hypothetical protein
MTYSYQMASLSLCYGVLSRISDNTARPDLAARPYHRRHTMSRVGPVIPVKTWRPHHLEITDTTTL